ncbi:MAG: aspartyl protease family protein [Alphaproteobacteria bacterium]|jgi:hypothetical protein|nr:aspartyl protease family protein [Alphaproteobacteria bacterium]
MARGDTTRRAALGLGLAAAGGALALGRAARAEAVVRAIHDASRLGTSENLYTPPTSLQGVADIYRRMTAPVRVNGEGPFPFVVDTGANQSVVSETLADRLGLVRGPLQELNGVAGAQPAPTTLATLGLGRRVNPRMRLFVLPDKGVGGMGMIGLDGLGGQTLTLDFQREMLRIDPPGLRLEREFDLTVKATERDGQLTLVDADLSGIPITAFIDSGAQNTIGNLALRGHAFKTGDDRLWRPTDVVSVTGQTVPAQMADLPNLRLGGLRMPNWPVAFADLHTFRMWDLIDRPALLVGVDVLTRFSQVTLDFARREVRFRVPDDPRLWLAKR